MENNGVKIETENPSEYVLFNEEDNIAYVLDSKTNSFIRSYDLNTQKELIYADMPSVFDKIFKD